MVLASSAISTITILTHLFEAGVGGFSQRRECGTMKRWKSVNLKFSIHYRGGKGGAKASIKHSLQI